MKWGFGLLLNSEPQPDMRAARQRRVGGRVFQVYIDFERALYASIDTGTVRSRRFERVPEEATQT